jgi:hypothetical protein
MLEQAKKEYVSVASAPDEAQSSESSSSPNKPSFDSSQ